jgi:hypothetical protein
MTHVHRPNTAGIPTGVAPHIEKQAELRKARLAKAPENLELDAPGNAV